MTLLDRFRTTLPQNSPDAAERLQYIEALPLDERAAIASMAREDEDARVRRAAVGKLMDPAALAAIASDDRDETVRAAAGTMLRDLALEAFEGFGETEGLEAVSAMADARALAQVAKTATRETVALLALARIGDSRQLGSVARHAASEAVRRGALAQLRDRGDRTELLAVAMHSDFKDTALSALEVLTEPAELEQVADRATNKSAAKRARTILREAAEARAREAAEAEAAAREAALAVAEREAEVRRTLEAAKADPQPASSAGPVSETVAAPGPDTTPVDPVAAAAQAEEETQRRAAEDAEALLRRDARLVELADEAHAASVDPDLSQARRRLAAAGREWKALLRGPDARPDLQERLTQAETDVSRREAELRAADERARREALARVRNLLARVEPLMTSTTFSLKAGERALRDVRAALADLPPLPSKQDVDELTSQLQAALDGLGPKVRDARQDAEWRQFANAGLQEQLCVQMEALQAVEDPEKIVAEIKTLQEQWRAAADVPRAQADALWRRFKAGHDAVWTRCQAYFEAQAQQRAANLAKKIALCERAEAIADSTNWIKTADEIKALQAEWKTVGAVSRGRERAIWERFRAACDRFFTRRHEDLAERKTAWAANYARKEALCVQAEALAESTDWDAAATALKNLQAEWKTIGTVKKSRSEAIWQRFRGACDRFFARYATRHELARAERAEAREAICAELEAMAAPPADVPEGDPARAPEEPPLNLPARLREIRVRWQQEIAARGVEPVRARALDERFAAAFAATLARWPSAVAGSDLDPEANRQRMEALLRRVEALAASLANPSAAGADAAVSPTTRLAAMLKEALASNTIGGKVDDDSRRRVAVEDMRQAQASWSKVGPVPDDVRRRLADRFQRACRLVADRARV